MLSLFLCTASLSLLACDDDEPESAQTLKVGASCVADEDCQTGQRCLTQFRGGYCGVEECSLDADCPSGSRCVAHEDDQNYCFLSCVDKSECNADRDPDQEANCSANITFTQEPANGKACVPPSGS